MTLIVSAVLVQNKKMRKWTN